jgi:hypothetical protein
MSAAFGRSTRTDISGLPEFIDVSTSTTPLNCFARATSCLLYASSFDRSGPLMMNWMSAFWLPPPPMLAIGCTDVRRFAASGGNTSFRIVSMMLN